MGTESEDGQVREHHQLLIWRKVGSQDRCTELLPKTRVSDTARGSSAGTSCSSSADSSGDGAIRASREPGSKRCLLQCIFSEQEEEKTTETPSK